MKKLISFLIFLILVILSLWSTEAEAHINRKNMVLTIRPQAHAHLQMGKRTLGLEQKGPAVYVD